MRAVCEYDPSTALVTLHSSSLSPRLIAFLLFHSFFRASNYRLIRLEGEWRFDLGLVCFVRLVDLALLRTLQEFNATDMIHRLRSLSSVSHLYRLITFLFFDSFFHATN